MLLLFLTPLAAELGYQEPWGKDAALLHPESSLTKVPKTEGFWNKVAEQVIFFHQRVLSPVDGPRSHFRPSSSCFMLLAMKRHGFLKGYITGCDRLLRENKEEWVYRTITEDGETYKYDPTVAGRRGLDDVLYQRHLP